MCRLHSFCLQAFFSLDIQLILPGTHFCPRVTTLTHSTVSVEQQSCHPRTPFCHPLHIGSGVTLSAAYHQQLNSRHDPPFHLGVKSFVTYRSLGYYHHYHLSTGFQLVCFSSTLLLDWIQQYLLNI